MRLIQKVPPKGAGLAIGYGISPSHDDQIIGQAIPNWGLVLCSYASEFLNTTKLQDARRLAGCDASTPLLLIGFGEGVKTVFSGFLSNTTHTVSGVAMFGGEWPMWAPDGFHMATLRGMAERSVKGLAPRLVVYAPDAPAAVRAALGATLLAPDAGPEDDTTLAHRASRVLSLDFGPASEEMPEPEIP